LWKKSNICVRALKKGSFEWEDDETLVALSRNEEPAPPSSTITTCSGQEISALLKQASAS